MPDEPATPMADPDAPTAIAGRRLDRPWTVVLLALVVAVLGFAFSQVLPWAAFEGLTAAGISLPALGATTLQLVLIELAGFGGATLVYLRLRGRGSGYVGLRWPSLRDVGWIVGGTVLVVVLYYGVAIGAILAGVEIAPTAIGEYGQREPNALLLVALLSLVLVGPMEELFFRGIVQGTMREALPARFAIPLASATFAAMHVFAFRGQLVLLGSLFLTAMVMGYAYERTGNLAVAAVVHGGYNAVVALLAYAVIVSGLAPQAALVAALLG